MYNWEQSLSLLLDSGSTGIYKYCKVDQIVLLDTKSNTAWNFFTHVMFSSEYISEAESILLCPPISIKSDLKLFVSQYQMSKDKFRECTRSAILSNKWNYTDSKIDDGELIDDAFSTPIKFIAANDPTGSLYNNEIPLEKALYGSNFIGNYYIFEIYARGDHINKMLSFKDIRKIQQVIFKCKLNYRLDELTDRIGNIICKFDIASLVAIPKNFSSFSMNYSYQLSPEIKCAYNLHFHVEQEHDRLLYEYSDEDFVLNPGEVVEKRIETNQCKTTITVTDRNTQLILFRMVSDQSVYSNYKGQINPEIAVASISNDYREIILNGKKEKITFINLKMIDEPPLLIEMADAGKRQQRWEERFFAEQKYFNVYNDGDHNKAISDIREIINGNLLWDLQEIRLIDPYLCAEDILKTVAFCKKKNIRVCCLTDIHTISGNKEAKNELIQGTSDNANYDAIRSQFKEKLEKGLGSLSDLRLSFRSVHGNNGISFHDRYLILKYELNTTRVWSLGTSVNSIGKSHHIIQIVESPMQIDRFFEIVWRQTDTEKCKVFEFSDYLS